MKKVLLILALIQFSVIGSAQKFYHAQTSGSNTSSGVVRAVEVDSENNTIVFGTYNSSLYLGELALDGIGRTNYYLAKYDNTGQILWAHGIGSETNIYVEHNKVGLAIDASDQIYLTASYKDQIIFHDGTAINSDASSISDFFVAKYSPQGDLEYAWTQQAIDAVSRDIAIDADNNVYLAGSYSGSITFNDASSTTRTSVGGQDAFIAKYDDNGINQWSRSLGNADNDDLSFGVEVAGSNIYWGLNYKIGITSKLYYIYMVKLTTNNTQVWVNYANSTDSGTGFLNDATCLKVEGSSVYVAGNFRGGIQFQGGSHLTTSTFSQALALKYTDNGTSVTNNWIVGRGFNSFNYAYTIDVQGSSVYLARMSHPRTYIDELSNDGGGFVRSTSASTPNPDSFEYIYGMQIDSNSKLHFGGYFYEDIAYGDQRWTGTYSNLFVAQSDLLLNTEWIKGSYDHFIQYKKSIIDADGNTYVGGTFKGSMRINGEDVFSKGKTDIIVEKYDPYGNFLFRKYAGSSLLDNFGDIATYDNELYLAGSFNVADGSIQLEIDDQTLSGDEYQEVFLAKFDQSGDLTLLKRAASTEGDLEVANIDLDPDGNIYLYGDASGGSPKNFGDGVFLSFDDQGFFLSKYAPDGTTQWVQSVNGTINRTMQVGQNNNIIITGNYNSADITFEEQSLPYTAGYDFFVAQYDYNGAFKWVYAAGGSSTDIMQGIATDPRDSSVYAAGYFYNAINLPDKTHTGTLTQLLLTKFDKNGNFIWARSGGGSRFDEAMDIELDTAGNLILVGQYEGTDAFFEDYNPSGLGTNDLEALILSYDPDGNLLEGHHWGIPTDFEEGNDDEYFQSIYIDANNDISLTGQFVGEVMLDTISVKYNSYLSTFTTKMSLNDCAYWGEVNFEHGTNLNAGSPVSFFDLTEFIGSTAEGWAWDFGDGQASDLQNPTHIFNKSGNYDVTLTVAYNTSCKLSFSKNLAIGLAKTVNAGDDLTICEGEQASLSGNQGGGFASVQWNTTGDGDFSGADNIETLYTPGSADISNGFVTLILSGLDDEASDSDTLQLSIIPAFEVTDQSFELLEGTSLSISLDSLFELDESITVSILNQPQLGMASLSGYVLKYTASTEQETEEVIQIQFANSCFEEPIEFVFDIEVEAEEPAIQTVEVYNAVSPNGDGKHDFLKINHIEHFPNNQLTIVNRNGQVVYEAKGYDNQSTVFEGKSNKGKIENLPDGTYFYVLKINELELRKSGHLLLKR